MMLAMQFQLQQTQWWSAERLAECQFRQLQSLMRHAVEQVPFYERLYADIGFDPRHDDLRANWSRLPTFDRTRLQEAEKDLVARRMPKGHGRISRMRSSGSTGRPISTYRSALNGFLWSVMTVRDHLWHRRDLDGVHAVIRAKGDVDVHGSEVKQWGRSTAMAFDTGPAALLHVTVDLEDQRRWVLEKNPHYLLSYPTNLRELARLFSEKGGEVPNLRQVRTFGEMVPEGVREACREAWGVSLADMYSAEEVGYMALQCPDHEHYHVQAETVLLEVVDDDGRACGPGEVGRVIVTVLHNYVAPLIRYEITDYAEVGEPCPCGRGLPVLKRIVGRSRNMIRMPDGTRHWPSFHVDRWAAAAPVKQIRMVQHAVDRIEVIIVPGRPFTEQEEASLVEAMTVTLGHPGPYDLRYVDRIERSPGGKYEDFIGMG